MRYYANGFTFKLEQLKDGWWSIYRLNEFTGEYMPQIQAFNLECWRKRRKWRDRMKCDSCEMIIKKNDRVILDENGTIQCLDCAKHSKSIVFNEENVFEFKGEQQ